MWVDSIFPTSCSVILCKSHNLSELQFPYPKSRNTAVLIITLFHLSLHSFNYQYSFLCGRLCAGCREFNGKEGRECKAGPHEARHVVGTLPVHPHGPRRAKGGSEMWAQPSAQHRCSRVPRPPVPFPHSPPQATSSDFWSQ